MSEINMDLNSTRINVFDDANNTTVNLFDEDSFTCNNVSEMFDVSHINYRQQLVLEWMVKRETREEPHGGIISNYELIRY